MKNFFIGLKLFAVLSVICGVIYPLAITGLSQIFFPYQANGSMLAYNDKLLGSELIGQQFNKPEYFWGRPSTINCNPMPSGASNLGPTSNKLKSIIQSRIDSISKYQNIPNVKEIPNDLLFASGSGVDPDISPEAVFFQLPRVVKYRNLDSAKTEKLINLIASCTENPQFGFLGMPKVNILKLNLKLNSM
jgi:potassium-transporting ATPase KdpC subunit